MCRLIFILQLYFCIKTVAQDGMMRFKYLTNFCVESKYSLNSYLYTLGNRSFRSCFRREPGFNHGKCLISVRDYLWTDILLWKQRSSTEDNLWWRTCPFHKQELLLVSGKETHNLTALSFNSCSHISSYYHFYFLFLAFTFSLFSWYWEYTHCFFS